MTRTLPLTERKVAHARPVAQSAIRVLTHLTSRPQTAGLSRMRLPREQIR